MASDATILVISTLGVLPAGLVFLFSPELRSGTDLRRGSIYAFGTGICGSAGNLLMLQSLAAGGDASVVLPLTGMFPLVTVLGALVLLGERLAIVQWGGVGLAMAALFCFNAVAPASPGTLKLGAAWLAPALGALLLWGIAGVLQKLAADRISQERATLCFALAFVPVAMVVAALFPVAWTLPGPGAWALVLLFGLLIGVGTLVLFAAYRDGKASVVTPVYALYPGITVLLAVPVFGERLDGWRVAAIGLALAAAVMLSREAGPDAAR